MIVLRTPARRRITDGLDRARMNIIYDNPGPIVGDVLIAMEPYRPLRRYNLLEYIHNANYSSPDQTPEPIPDANQY